MLLHLQLTLLSHRSLCLSTVFVVSMLLPWFSLSPPGVRIPAAWHYKVVHRIAPFSQIKLVL